ncbi:hypothetical protein [Fusobacterium nucleatum]|uniref:MORN repeat protein n=1 Tax=Fusobacterium nucleatum TaxID=851 RepID=A0A323TZ84_FUSNU|nr:hypothetical protein [Fusobacterium nucleatum]PCR85601.1 hypothetical protein CQA79_03445 [Fusobacterium nucleatum]PZA04470.1 hypothetical protein DNF10_06580 [Fusobacterium nucleatum]QJX51612.1 hypothetical protein HOO60_07240 [Fusobacterium nucleatum]HCE33667.1 hypothetical protein [Fusobacterium sp.]
MFIIILSTLLSSCLAINEFLAESEVRDAKKISHYAPVIYQKPYEEIVNTTLVQTYKNDILEKTAIYYPSGKIYMKRNYNKTYEITYYYENGQIFLSGYVKNNAAYGEWKYYDKKGKLVAKGEYNKISKAFEIVFAENLKKTLKNN